MKNNSLLPKVRVSVRLISPDYPYYGFIIGRDTDFLYLNTGFGDDKGLGVIIIPFINIAYIQEKKVSM